MKKFTLLLLSIVMAIVAQAADVTPEEALQKARTFIQKREATGSRVRRAPGKAPQLKSEKRVCGLYVFNIGDSEGYVIVSNDDRVTPILGYSDTGTIDPDNMPINMKAWLQSYADQIAWLNLQRSAASAATIGTSTVHRVGAHATTTIAPMVSTTWNQSAPYNNLCPNYSASNKAVTGCVATAMAQVMNYHKWPQSATTSIPGYTTKSYGINLSAGLPAVTFDWSNMLDSYSSSATGATADAVATLMQYCGYSVEMDYGPSSGSNSAKVVTALKNYYGYNSTTQIVVRSLYTADKWADLIYHEIANGRPVIYGGKSSGGGHEFVCDGYKYENGTDFFHINWGWGGLSNDYFVLSALDPDQQGIGGSSSDDGYHYGQDAVIGIQPSTGTGTVADIKANVINLKVNSMTPSSNPAPAGAPVSITLNVTNNGSEDYDGDVYLGQQYEVSGATSYSLLEGNNFLIPAGQTKDISISFTPYTEGAYSLVYFLPNEQGSYSTNGVVMTTLTVGTAETNEYVPVYGYRCDELSRSQFIIPAANLEDMKYATLKGVTFYANTSSAINWGSAEFDVYVSEVSSATLSQLKDWNSLQKVYSGKLSVESNGKMTVTFDTPFEYQNNNLLIGINQTISGTYAQSQWIGKTLSGVSLAGYNSNISQRNFLPNTTFSYTSASEPSVTKPIEVAVAYTGGTTAEVSWTSSESAWDIDVNGVITENVTNPYTLTGLSNSTDYTIKVRAKKGAEVSEWSLPVTFTTETTCPAPLNLAVTPYSTTANVAWTGSADSYDLRYKKELEASIVNNFDGSSFGAWTTIDADADGKGWEIYSTSTSYLSSAPGTGRGRQSSTDMVVSGSYSNASGVLHPDNFLVSPQVALGGTITFWACAPSSYYAEHFGIAVSTSGNTTASDFTVVKEWTMDEGSVWKQYTVDLSAYAGQMGYIAIRHFDCSDQFILCIDDIEITQSEDALPWTTIQNITETNYELTGLETGSPYKVEVRGNYGSEGYSEWISTTFSTPTACDVPSNLVAKGVTHNAATLTWTGYQDSYNVRYRTKGGSDELFFEDFENGISAWTRCDGGIFTGIPYSGTHFTILGYSSTDAQYLISSAIPEVEAGSTVQFYQRYFTAANTFKVGFSTTTSDVSAFTWGSEQNATNSYTLYSEEIPVGTKYIAIQVTAAASANAVLIDDWGIYSPYVMPGSWTTATTTEATHAASDLNAETEYEWQVQGVSEACGGVTDWSESATFTTYKLMELADNADNSAVINTHDRETVCAVLTGRTLWKDNSWNTLCLPFNLEKLDGTPLEGATLRQLNTSTSNFDSETGLLTVNFSDVASVEAGMPYVVKWDSGDDITNPAFAGVKIDATKPATSVVTSDGLVQMLGNYAPVTLTSNTSANLFMGADNTLYYPNVNDFSVNAFRAYFLVDLGRGLGIANPSALGVRALVINFGDDDDVTCIENINSKEVDSERHSGIYTLDGRRLQSMPTQPGIYIVNGKKLIIK